MDQTNKEDSNTAPIFAYLFLAAAFVAGLYNTVAGRFFEQDLMWCMPTVVQSAAGTSVGQLLKFLIDPAPIMYGLPSLKVYMYTVTKLFGPIPAYLIFTAIIFHIVNSLLLYSLCRRMKLGVFTSLFSASIYLTFFAQFSAYMWPMAAQHLFVVFAILLVLNLYLKTEELIDGNVPHKAYYLGTLVANVIASLCRISVIILPVVVLTDIFFFSKDREARVKRFYRWLPLFITYLIYPLILLTYVGDNRVNIYLAHANQHMIYVLYLLFGIAALLSLGHVLKVSRNVRISRKIKITGIATMALACYGWLCLRDVRNLLLPYNLLVPFIASISAYLAPIQNVLLSDSSRPYDFIHLQLGISSFLLAVFLVIIFFRRVAGDRRRLLILLPWFLISFLYVNLRSPLASRYFIYISPIFAIVFSSATVYVAVALMNGLRLGDKVRRPSLVIFMITLCLANIIAIRLDILRDRLANNFFIYDYIKWANLIEKDVSLSEKDKTASPDDIYVDGVPVVTSKNWEFSPVDPSRYYNFRSVMATVFGDRSMVEVHINEKSPAGKSPVYNYSVRDETVLVRRGSYLDPFEKTLDKAVEMFKGRDYEKSRRLLLEAINTRPFLLNYILPQLELRDLRWIINEKDLTDWLKRIEAYYLSEYGAGERVRRIKLMMDEEVLSYIKALFYLSYIESISGDDRRSKEAFSMIGLLESDYARLHDVLMGMPDIASDSGMKAFLKNLDDTALYEEVAYRNIYEFERFLIRMIFGLDISKSEGKLIFTRRAMR